MELKRFSRAESSLGIKTLQKWTKSSKDCAPRRKPVKMKLSATKIKNLLEKQGFRALEQNIRQYSLSVENVILIFSYAVPDTFLNKVIKIAPELPEAMQLRLFKMSDRNLLKSYAWRYSLCDSVIKELIIRGEDDFLAGYIKRRKISEEMQCVLILAHKIKLVEQYISIHGLERKAQMEFLNFMKEYLSR